MLNILILICFFINFHHVEAQKGFTIKYTNFICDENTEWLRNVSCEIKAVNWKTNALEASAYTVKPIKKIMAHIQFFKRYSGYRPFLFNFTADACAYIGGVYNKLILKSLGPVTKKYTNLRKCPLEGHLYAHNLKADVFDFRSIWPSGDYKLNFHTYSDNFQNKVLHISFNFNVVED